MAPSRPRPVDDSHSRSDRDASSLPTTKAHHDRHSILGPTSHSSVQKSGTGRSSRPGQNGNSSAAATAAGSASASNSRQTGAGGNGNGNGAGATSTSMDGAIEEKELPKIHWSTLPTPLLHRYRLNLAPSLPPSHSLPHASAYLGQGFGLSSPSSIYYSRKRKTLSATHPTKKSSARQQQHQNGNGAGAGVGASRSGNGSGRIGKDDLANSVRKHFNSMAVNESEVVARFAYLVGAGVGGGSGGGGGTGGVEREFRLRFRP